MGSSTCKTLEQIGFPVGKNIRKGIFKGYCKCGMITADFDNGHCPICNGTVTTAEKQKGKDIWGEAHK